MPLYHVEHICPLVPSQKTQLAQRFTKTHVGIFKGTPSSFVNVRFTYTSPDQDASNNYVGGVARASNRMILNVRPGEARTYDMFVQLITELNQAWTDIVVAGSGESPETVMRATFLNAGIVAAMEAGFMVPKAGEEKQWVKDNLPDIKRKAKDGVPEAVMLLEEIETREEYKGLV